MSGGQSLTSPAQWEHYAEWLGGDHQIKIGGDTRLDAEMRRGT